jgi:hypothetical protein
LGCGRGGAKRSPDDVVLTLSHPDEQGDDEGADRNGPDTTTHRP